jgi:hypothetical protein
MALSRVTKSVREGLRHAELKLIRQLQVSDCSIVSVS